MLLSDIQQVLTFGAFEKVRGAVVSANRSLNTLLTTVSAISYSIRITVSRGGRLAVAKAATTGFLVGKVLDKLDSKGLLLIDQR